MVRLRNKVVLWPIYFDSEYSRRQGRRVVKAFASRRVSADEIVHAAKELGLNPNLRVEAAHPRRPLLKVGSVIVDKKGSKSQILGDIARMIHDSPRKK